MSCGFEPLYDSILFTILASGFVGAVLSVYKAVRNQKRLKETEKIGV